MNKKKVGAKIKRDSFLWSRCQWQGSKRKFGEAVGRNFEKSGCVRKEERKVDRAI